LVKRLTIKRRGDQPNTNGPTDAGGTTSQLALTRDPAHKPGG
jgi:hypothetical protein